MPVPPRSPASGPAPVCRRRRLEDPLAQFLSDALYDADKFRWGPDNFTEMLWDMVEYRKASLDAVLKRFLKGMEGIERVRETFRTRTGRIYGPDFIDRGIEIGMKFYAIMLSSEF